MRAPGFRRAAPRARRALPRYRREERSASGITPPAKSVAREIATSNGVADGLTDLASFDGGSSRPCALRRSPTTVRRKATCIASGSIHRRREVPGRIKRERRAWARPLRCLCPDARLGRPMCMRLERLGRIGKHEVR